MKIDNETKEFIREVFVLALPVGIQQIINLLVNLIDNIMVGQLGELAITAVSISGTYTWLVMVAGMGMARGANVIMSQYWGAGNVKKIKQLFSFVLTASVFVAMIFFVITSLFPAQIIRIYTSIPEFVEPGVSYLSILKYSFLLTGISQTSVIMLQSVRSVKIGLYNSILSCFTNIFLNWVLIFGHFGLPAMGVRGAALATVLARAIELIITLVYLFRFEPHLKFRIHEFDPVLDKEYLMSFVRITAPLLAIDILSNLVSSVQTMITGRISPYYISANSIVHMAWTIPNSFCVGTSTACNVMIGNLIGNNEFEKAKINARRFVKTAVVFGICSSAMVQVLLPILMSYYKVTQETLILTKQMGYAASCTVLFLPMTFMVFNGILKAGGQTKKLMIVDMIANWLIAIPFGYVAAFVFHWHPAVLYAVLRSGNLFKAIWALVQLKKDNWIHKIA